MTRRIKLAAIVVALLATSSAVAQQKEPANKRESFGGSYADLDADQRRLVDDWVERLGAILGKEIEPPELYANARLSTRTTYDAVTHALSTSELTDSDGKSLGTALGLIANLDSVHGKIRGAGGDQQFRLYVRLVPGAVEILEKSQEFQRRGDNRVYHKGFPQNFRQDGKVPNMQFSISSDDKRADIDVDYRASGFPSALFNGHLTASNSDVRAGNNHERHNGRWEGLDGWWRGLFGLRLRKSSYEDEGGEFVVPDDRPAGKKKLQDATLDFLQSWLVEGEPNLSVAYVSDDSLGCMALLPSEMPDPGMARPRLLMRMRAVHLGLGKPEKLSDRVVGVRLNDPALRVIRQPHHSQFVLYEVPNDVAGSFMCDARAEGARKTKVGKGARQQYGKYFAAIFFVKGYQEHGATVVLLWQKVTGHWRIVAWDSEPEGVPDEALRDLRPAADSDEIVIQRVDGPVALADAASGFFTSWLVKKDYQRASGYISDTSLACLGLFDAEPKPEPKTPEEGRRRLLAGLAEVGKEVGRVRRLDDVIEGHEPLHPDIRIVKHDQDAAFTLLDVPTHISEALDCRRLRRGEEVSLRTDGKLEYGRYYGAANRFVVETGESPVFYTVWHEDEGDWRIAWYEVEVP